MTVAARLTMVDDELPDFRGDLAMATGKDPREMPLDLYCDAVYAWLRNRVSQSENAEREWRRVTDELWRDARPEPDRTGGHGLETFATGLASLAR